MRAALRVGGALHAMGQRVKTLVSAVDNNDSDNKIALRRLRELCDCLSFIEHAVFDSVDSQHALLTASGVVDALVVALKQSLMQGKFCE